MIAPSTLTRKHRARPLRMGVLVSFSLHAALAGGLVIVPRGWRFAGGSPRDHQSITLLAAVDRREHDSRRHVRFVREPAEVRGDMVEKRLDELVSEAKTLREDEQLRRFEQLARRLEDVSDGDSIDRFTPKFHQWLGTKPRAAKPSEERVAGVFDADTAQLHDVSRERSADGQWRYWLVLLDAEGRTIEVAVGSVEGERLYKTMQQIKAFPLAEKVYRQITMPLMDKILDSKRQTRDIRPGTAAAPDGPSAR